MAPTVDISMPLPASELAGAAAAAAATSAALSSSWKLTAQLSPFASEASDTVVRTVDVAGEAPGAGTLEDGLPLI